MVPSPETAVLNVVQSPDERYPSCAPLDCKIETVLTKRESGELKVKVGSNPVCPDVA